jgi:putative NIF3 family GTP cyclohydrolase 1 type 2
MQINIGKVKEMSKSKKDPQALAKTPGQAIAKSNRIFSVGDIEKVLLKAFPAKDALEWDVVGLTVGEGALEVTLVAVALDASVKNIEAAAAAGANVLVTHHPPYLEGPKVFGPGKSSAENSGAVVWAAIRNKVALINCHTNLDVSPSAHMMIPGMLALKPTGKVVEPLEANPDLGFGAICKPGEADGASVTLRALAARCVSVFGRLPRVWGDFDHKLKTIVCITGSAGPTAAAAFAAGADCIICGEIKYHEALDLSQAGMSVIELGHDVSELPLTAVLAQTLADAGVGTDKIIMLEEADNWQTPESIRL